MTSKSVGFAISALFLAAFQNGAAHTIPTSHTIFATVPVNMIPTISTPNGPYFCDGGNVTLTCSVADSYQWYKDNQIINGATGQTYSASSNGVYKVTVSYGEGSTGTSAGLNVRQANLWTGTAADDEWSNPANWSCGVVPQATDHVVITQTIGTFPVISDESTISVYSLALGELAHVEVEGGSTLQVTDIVTVHPTAILNLQNNASLVQINDVNNVGNISAHRTTTPMKRYDFTYWSSPVSGQTLYNLSPLTLADKYYSFSPAIGNWVGHLNGAQVMEEGKGYIVRAPQTFSPTATATFDAQFLGNPNNGNVSAPIVIGNSEMNLLGNPYPSAISLDAFLSDPTNATLIDGTVYLWTHNSSPVGNEGNTSYDYTSNDYAAYNMLGGTATTTTGNNEEPTGKLASGQGFFVKGLTAGQAVFNNSMRVAASNDQFFRSNSATAPEKHRLWLNLSNNQGAFKQTLLGYTTGATDGVDRDFDGIDFNGNAFIDLYTIAADKHFTIQGRALPFDENNSIPLGYSTTLAGTFSVALAAFDGLFETQQVYLYDYADGTTHDLKNGNYEFTSAIGTFNNRFELRFTNGLLATQIFSADQVMVAAENGTIDIRSAEMIQSVTVLDLSGRKLSEQKGVNAKAVLVNSNPHNAVLLVKLEMANGLIYTKKVLMD